VVRVLTRILTNAEEFASGIQFSDHTKRAKRRMLDILNARSMDDRIPLYRELLQITGWTMGYATQAAATLATIADLQAYAAEQSLLHYLDLGRKVVDQTERRVVQQESVPATEKIVSIFEPHTDIIVKDRRETLYGHKVFLNVGASGMILDMLMERGNPADVTRAIPMLERHRDVMGRVPEQAAFDAGFTSSANIDSARELGVKAAYFARKGSIDVDKGVRNPRLRRKLSRFRAGVEGIISFTKRCFGMGRCLWSGYSSFQAYAWVSVISTNLLLMARRSLD
jgi:IS5 family transposase